MKGFIADIEDLTEGNTDFRRVLLACSAYVPGIPTRSLRASVLPPACIRRT